MILFFVASWSIGIVMDLSPTSGEAGMRPTPGDVQLLPILVLSLMIIATIAFLLRARTPTFAVAVLYLPATMLGTYLIVVVGFSWSLFLIFLIVGLSALAIWKGVKNERMSPYIGAVAVVGIFFLAVILFGRGGEMIDQEVGGNGDDPSISFPDPGRYLETTFGDFGTFMLVILIGGIIAFLLVQKAIPVIRSSTKKEEDEKELEDQLSSTVDRAVTELREGKDVYSTVLRCYQRMCLALEKKGAKNFEFMTPREFEIHAVKTLGVSASKISEIREVFELAKYSGHKLEEKERDKAMKALKELRKELG